MKLFYIIIAALILSVSTTQAEDFWKSTNGPKIGDGTVIGIQTLGTTNNSGVVFAGSAGNGLFKTTNNGDDWEKVNFGSQISVIFIARNDYIFVVENGALYRSTDGGNDWTQLGHGVIDVPIMSMTEDEDGTLYAGAGDEGGVFKSSDTGINWVQINNGLEHPDVFSILSDPSGFIWAGTFLGGIYVSHDKGENWEQEYDRIEFFVSDLEYDIHGHIYAGADGCYRTTNKGIEWSKVLSVSNDISSIASPKNFTPESYRDVVFASSLDGKGVYISEDFGSNWYPINEGLTSLTVSELLLDNSNVLYAATDAGVFRSVYTTTPSVEEAPNFITSYSIAPQPSADRLNLKLNLVHACDITISISDASGGKIKSYPPQFMSAGENDLRFELNDLVSGTYFCSIESEYGIEYVKFNVLK